jgi:hypothetical protein
MLPPGTGRSSTLIRRSWSPAFLVASRTVSRCTPALAAISSRDKSQTHLVEGFHTPFSRGGGADFCPPDGEPPMAEHGATHRPQRHADHGDAGKDRLTVKCQSWWSHSSSKRGSYSAPTARAGRSASREGGFWTTPFSAPNRWDSSRNLGDLLRRQVNDLHSRRPRRAFSSRRPSIARRM